MEQMRLLIAIGLSFAVFFLWSIFFAPKQPEETSEVARQESTEQETSVPNTSEAPATIQNTVVQPQPADTAPTVRPSRKIAISTPLYTITLSEQGGAVVSMVLKDFRETVEEDSPLKELISKELTGGTVIVDFLGMGKGNGSRVNYTADFESDRMEVRDQEAAIRFLHTGENGVQIEKTYRFSPDSYLVGLNVTVYNSGTGVIKDSISISLNSLMDKDSGSYAFEGPSSLINDGLEQVKIKKIEDKNLFEGQIKWAAIESRYFMTSIVPTEAVDGKLKLAYGDDGKVTNQLVISESLLNPQQGASFDFDIFMGPKSNSLLRSFNNSLDRAIDFGWVDILAKPCLWFMNYIHRFIPNYGVAIIILTIVTRLIFWPLATKSYKSMGEMRKLQPLMQEIREKYKNDKQRMNQEMMGLYRTYKINPMGGCLPMLIQLPVFFALYRMLYQAIELRHAPFMWWINDLSAPDRLFNFGFKIPLMEPPYGIPVLTLVMAGTMFLQQKMTPTPGDPAQAKMMMFLPLIFLFIFINFSSGLVLYWLISNVLSISQQYYIQKKVA
jgi:YidC/Oxa1 family membrane protein insertase